MTVSNYVLETYNRISLDMLNELRLFCRQASKENRKEASVNMLVRDWENNPSSLLYLLFIEKRFDTGIFNVVRHEGKIISVSGLYTSDFDENIVIGGVRTWTLKEHRSLYLHGKIIFPEQEKWAKENNKKMFLLSFNAYNRSLMDLILRTNTGRVTRFGMRNPEFYKGFLMHDKPVMIKYTPQWILYKYFDTDYQFDFTKIEYEEIVNDQ